MLSVCAQVAYDGTDYAGFQVQRRQPTVQGALEEALEALTRRQCRVIGSGRTDSGVHASGQVISVDLPWSHSLSALHRAWNHHLPDAILVGRLREKPAGFHPRFSASRRSYRYRLYQPVEDIEGIRRHPLLDRFALILDRKIDSNAMNRASTVLMGEQNFSTFGTPPQGDNHVRRIFECAWVTPLDATITASTCGLVPLDFVITGNAFLKRMVRNIVGSLLKIGRGEWQKQDLVDALQARDRGRSAPPAPPHGLYLERVEYREFPDLFE